MIFVYYFKHFFSHYGATHLAIGRLAVVGRTVKNARHGFAYIASFLITVQQDVTYSVYYISVGSSTCFVCRRPSSGARTTVITASGID